MTVSHLINASAGSAVLEPAYDIYPLALPAGLIKRSGSGANVGEKYASNQCRLGKAKRAQHPSSISVNKTHPTGRVRSTHQKPSTDNSANKSKVRTDGRSTPTHKEVA